MNPKIEIPLNVRRVLYAIVIVCMIVLPYVEAVAAPHIVATLTTAISILGAVAGVTALAHPTKKEQNSNE